jgi:hypothetical protein
MTYGFVIAGDIEIPDDAEILYDGMGEILGFQLSNGDAIGLFAAIDVNAFSRVLWTDYELQSIGCQITDYHETSFYKIDKTKEELDYDQKT